MTNQSKATIGLVTLLASLYFFSFLLHLWLHWVDRAPKMDVTSNRLVLFSFCYLGLALISSSFHMILLLLLSPISTHPSFLPRSLHSVGHDPPPPYYYYVRNLSARLGRTIPLVSGKTQTHTPVAIA